MDGVTDAINVDRDVTTVTGAVYAWEGLKISKFVSRASRSVAAVIWINYSNLGLGFIWGIVGVKVRSYAIVYRLETDWGTLPCSVLLDLIHLCYGLTEVVSPVSPELGPEAIYRRSLFIGLSGVLAASQFIRRWPISCSPAICCHRRLVADVSATTVTFLQFGPLCTSTRQLPRAAPPCCRRLLGFLWVLRPFVSWTVTLTVLDAMFDSWNGHLCIHI